MKYFKTFITFTGNFVKLPTPSVKVINCINLLHLLVNLQTYQRGLVKVKKINISNNLSPYQSIYYVY